MRRQGLTTKPKQAQTISKRMTTMLVLVSGRVNGLTTSFESAEFARVSHCRNRTRSLLCKRLRNLVS